MYSVLELADFEYAFGKGYCAGFLSRKRVSGCWECSRTDTIVQHTALQSMIYVTLRYRTLECLLFRLIIQSRGAKKPQDTVERQQGKKAREAADHQVA